MMTLWIVLGALFMTGIGIRFTYRVLGLTPVEATAVFVMIVTLVGVNTGPARQILMNLFYERDKPPWEARPLKERKKPPPSKSGPGTAGSSAPDLCS